MLTNLDIDMIITTITILQNSLISTKDYVYEIGGFNHFIILVQDFLKSKPQIFGKDKLTSIDGIFYQLPFHHNIVTSANNYCQSSFRILMPVFYKNKLTLLETLN